MAVRVAADIGNSRIAFADFEGDALIRKWHHPLSAVKKSAREIADRRLAGEDLAICVSSVVPSATGLLTAIMEDAGIAVTRLSVDEQTIIKSTYPTMGTDRLANAIAGHRLYGEPGRTVAIIDFGSATTLTAVDSGGTLLGGLITLGLKTTLTALNASLEQLPILSLAQKIEACKLTVFAGTTEDAILNGTILSHLAMVESWLKKCRELSQEPVNFIATGGLAHIVSGALPEEILVDQDLTLKGINLFGREAEDPGDRA
ncbi:MAG: type III pantothenate kinase [Candidatus Melainabacteria bacterium]|nr:type III pantothenate kinase [Candidatus Melainabacteria bacterium]